MTPEYIAVVINSTIRSSTPIIFAALGSLLCARAGIFNIALEAQMLVACFAGIAVNFLTHNFWMGILAGMAAGMAVSAIVALLQVVLKSADTVIGTSLNLFIQGMTTLMLTILFGVRGTFNNPELIPVPSISLRFLPESSFAAQVFENLSFLDYLSYVMAILMFIYMFKTVSGFRLRSVGINKEASISMGIRATSMQVGAALASGIFCGLGGCALAMSQVTLFTENMTAGRGFIAMAASVMGMDHPLYILLSSLFFGAMQAVGVALQQNVPSQLTMAVPYVATVLVLCINGFRNRKNRTVVLGQ